jgi:hypothetical protein
VVGKRKGTAQLVIGRHANGRLDTALVWNGPETLTAIGAARVFRRLSTRLGGLRYSLTLVYSLLSVFLLSINIRRKPAGLATGPLVVLFRSSPYFLLRDFLFRYFLPRYFLPRYFLPRYFLPRYFLLRYSLKARDQCEEVREQQERIAGLPPT